MLFVFRHFWTPYFVKGHILRRDMPAFSSSSTPGMYNNEDWRQFYRLNKDGIGGAGGTAQGADGLGYGCTPGTHYIPNELYNELIRLNYYGTIDFGGDQGSPRGV